MSEQRYVPAAGRALLTGLYDPVMALTMREGRWRPALLDEVAAKLPQGGTVVDVGAGTGSFAITLSAARPDSSVLAVDGDPDVLDRARRKHGADAVEWRAGLAGQLPLEAEEADAVVMSLLLHHLVPEAKQTALTDAYRALRPAGWLHVADWGRPLGAFPRAGFMALRVLDGLDGTRDHAAGRLPSVIAAAGFDDPSVWMRLSTAWGTLELLSGRRPAAKAA
jgi:ubiquinone/menaquinone biosynthesis C-methylase UbiE